MRWSGASPELQSQSKGNTIFCDPSVGVPVRFVSIEFSIIDHFFHPYNDRNNNKYLHCQFLGR